MSKSDHDTCKQASHTIPATSIASVSVIVPRFVRIIRISSLARHLLSADFYLGITRGVRLQVGGKGLSMLGVSRAGVRFCTGASPRRYAITWSAALRPSQSCWRITSRRRASSKRPYCGCGPSERVALAVSTLLFQRSSRWLSRFLAVYSSYQIVTVIRVCHPSPSSSCSVIAVDMCVTEALGPRLICHLLISLSSSPIDFLPCT